MAGRFATVDDYAASLPEGVRPVLEEVRRVVHRVVPGCEETISYRMPTFVLDGQPLVRVAAWKKHLGLHPLPRWTASSRRRSSPTAVPRTRCSCATTGPCPTTWSNG